MSIYICKNIIIYTYIYILHASVYMTCVNAHQQERTRFQLSDVAFAGPSFLLALDRAEQNLSWESGDWLGNLTPGNGLVHRGFVEWIASTSRHFDPC